MHLPFNSIMCIIIHLYCCEFRSNKLCRLNCRVASSFGWMCCLDGRDASYRIVCNIIIDVSLVRRLDGPDGIQLLGYSNCVVCLVSCLDHYFVVSYCVL